MNFVVIVENGKLVGFNLLVGGGLFIEYGNKKIYVCIVSEFGYLLLEYMLVVVEVVVMIQCDWGNCIDCKNVKIKYMFECVGVDMFKEEVECCVGIKFELICLYEFIGCGDCIGWVKGIDNNWYLMLFIENGCILDYLGCLLKIGLLEIVKIYQGEFCIIVNQNLIIVSVLESQKVKIEKLVCDYGLMNVVSVQCENLMVCVLFLICLLVMVEVECFLLLFIDKVEVILEKYGIFDEYIVMCVIGCLNGCGCVMLVEIGLVGKVSGCYNLYFGGNCIGICILWMY